MTPKKVQQFYSQLEQKRDRSDKTVRGLITRQLLTLLPTEKNNLIYQNRMNSILTTMPRMDKKQAVKATLTAYEYFYYEGIRRARHLVYDQSKITHAHHGQKHVNMYDLAQNVLIKRFGLGNPYRVLDVHGNRGRNTPMMTVITYI